MLRLSKKADYGLIAMKHLAATSSGAASAREIATTYGIPPPLLAKILQKLARNGLLRSAHGTNGGYKLARDPGTISALEVIRTIDGPMILASCFTQGQACYHSGKCSVREPLRKIHLGILQLLGSITISEMKDEPESAGQVRAFDAV